ncbi:MAG: clan AA aspartic protease [Polaribacter sp.]|nr:clan AA aspartic protease [Polaribacter sp.]
MKKLSKLLRKKYTAVKLKKTVTNHFEFKLKLNNIKGRFILDTGASNTCVSMDLIEHFKLHAEDTETKAAGAGATDMATQISKNNLLKIKKYKLDAVDIVLFDLSHVNTALKMHQAEEVQGIIGADILEKTKAIIDYQTKKLYLKK